MENPFEIISQQLIAIEQRLERIKNALKIGDDNQLVIFVKALLVKATHGKTGHPKYIVRKSREENIADFEAQFYSSRPIK